MDISRTDKNFKVETKLKEQDIDFRSAGEEPFAIYGVSYMGDRFRRMPKEVAERVNPGVLARHANTAGGRVRFVTDSPYIAIQAKLDNIARMSHFTLCGTGGFDLYAENDGEYQYRATFIPPYDSKDGYESISYTDGKERAYQINMPLYADVKELYIGVKEGSTLRAAEGYSDALPIVFLGSSITQGGCASRPGMAYEEILSRKLGFDYINLGFSGSCRAEDSMMEYIAALPMSAFVYDYDYNTHSPKHLAETHERGFLKVREANPDLPIILMSAPTFKRNEVFEARYRVVRATYENAKARGDENVYFIGGDELMALAGGEGTVDNCHPTDLGFVSMAAALEPVLRALKIF